MPKVYLTKQDKLNTRLVMLIYGMMKVNGISQQYLADRLGIKQPSLNRKLKKAQFTFQDLTIIFDVLGFSDEEILAVTRER